jgi:hypothetical protein
MFAIVILVLSGLQFLAFGIFALLNPVALLAPIGFTVGTTEALIEARAFYGGAEIALGALMLCAAFRAPWRKSGLVLVATVFGFVGGVRGALMLTTATHTKFLSFAVTVELVFAALALWALMRRQPRNDAYITRLR